MHKDLIEIEKILHLFGNKAASKNDTLFILGRICRKSDEESRKEKERVLLENRQELCSKIQPYIGWIVPLCKKDKCIDCPISKQCNTYRIELQKKEIDREGLVFADFFCGAGGLSWGFHRAGYKLSLANDIQECCIDTFSLNHPEVPEQHIISGDINHIIDNLEEHLRFKNVDIVVGGPPCQGFSMANRQRIIDDPRNHLYKSYIKAIKSLQPRFFVMENVRGMLGAKKQIIEDFAAIGYVADAHIVNTKDFGIPQSRERVIFIGNSIGVDNELVFQFMCEMQQNLKTVNLMDAIDDLPVLYAKRKANNTECEDDSSGYTFSLVSTSMKQKRNKKYLRTINEGRRTALLLNHKARYNNDRDIEIFRRLAPGDNSADPKIADIMPYKRREKIFKDKYFKLEPQKPCKTITAHMKYDCNMYIHPFQARGLTPREAARVQSFPDDYFFRGAYTKTYMQVGNSVPPLIGEIIANAIKKVLEMEEKKNGSI